MKAYETATNYSTNLATKATDEQRTEQHEQECRKDLEHALLLAEIRFDWETYSNLYKELYSVYPSDAEFRRFCS